MSTNIIQFVSGYIITILMALSLKPALNSAACTCMDSPTTAQAYQRSHLVIQGRIIGVDTIQSSKSIVHDKKGIKVGRHRYAVYSETFLRVKMIVEQSFKATPDLPDTIFILTNIESTACGYFFPPVVLETVAQDFYRYIIYGYSFTEMSIVKTRKNRGELKETLLKNTFFTNTCSRTQHLNESELKNLLTLPK